MVRDELVHRGYDRGRGRNQGTGNHFRPRKNTQEGQEGFRRHRADPGMERVRRARARRRD